VFQFVAYSSCQPAASLSRPPSTNGKLSNPHFLLLIGHLIVCRPDIIIELTELLTVPVKAVEVDIGACIVYPLKEVFEPHDSLRSRRDARATTPYAGFSKRLYASDPFTCRELGAHVRLIWEFRLSERWSVFLAAMVDAVLANLVKPKRRRCMCRFCFGVELVDAHICVVCCQPQIRYALAPTHDSIALARSRSSWHWVCWLATNCIASMAVSLGY
jgi:hypothetical protein